MIELLELLDGELVHIKRCDQRLEVSGVELEPDDAQGHEVVIRMKPCLLLLVLAVSAWCVDDLRLAFGLKALVRIGLAGRHDETDSLVTGLQRQRVDLLDETCVRYSEEEIRVCIHYGGNQVEGPVAPVRNDKVPTRCPSDAPDHLAGGFYLVCSRPVLNETVEIGVVEYVIQCIDVELVESSGRVALRREISRCTRIVCDVDVRPVDSKQAIAVMETEVVASRPAVEASERYLKRLRPDLVAALDEGGLCDERFLRVEVIEFAEFLVERIAFHHQYSPHCLGKR